MFDPSALKYMTAEQRHHVSMLGVQAREIKRLAREPQPYSVISSGLQIAVLIMDLRCDITQYHHALLFQAGSYHNRYRRIVDNQKHDGLICWSDAFREMERLIRPIRKDLLLDY